MNTQETDAFKKSLNKTKNNIQNIKTYIGLIKIDSPQLLINDMGPGKDNKKLFDTYPECLKNNVEKYIESRQNNPEPLYMLPEHAITILDYLNNCLNIYLNEYDDKYGKQDIIKNQNKEAIQNDELNQDQTEEQEENSKLTEELQQEQVPDIVDCLTLVKGTLNEKNKVNNDFWEKVKLIMNCVQQINQYYEEFADTYEIDDTTKGQTCTQIWDSINKLVKDEVDQDVDENEETQSSDEDSEDSNIPRLYQLRSVSFFSETNFHMRLFKISYNNLQTLIDSFDDNLCEIMNNCDLYTQMFKDISTAKEFWKKYSPRALETLAQEILEIIGYSSQQPLQMLEKALRAAWEKINKNAESNKNTELSMNNLPERIQKISDYIIAQNSKQQENDKNQELKKQNTAKQQLEFFQKIKNFCNSKGSFLKGINQFLEEEAKKYGLMSMLSL